MQPRDSLRHPMQLYRHVLEWLAREEPMGLATVISRSGSGPREAGAAMAISQDGQTVGTVGGGLLEARTLEMARTAIRDRFSVCLTFSLSDREASEEGMVCGGRMEVLLEYMDGNDPVYPEIFAALLECGEKGHSCRLIRSIRTSDKEGVVETGLGLLDDGVCRTGSLHPAGLDIQMLDQACKGPEPTLIACGDARYFIQPIDIPETVFIFGAGHVGQELATVCHLAGFRTVVIDDRREFAHVERFPTADEMIVVDSFKECFSGLTVGNSAYVVIVTRGHGHDQTVLSRALGTPARYIGMIASRRKRDIIFRSLMDEGFSGEDLARVHSPIGLDIGARTPAEIAVSIVAELIAVRAGRDQRKVGSGT